MLKSINAGPLTAKEQNWFNNRIDRSELLDNLKNRIFINSIPAAITGINSDRPMLITKVSGLDKNYMEIELSIDELIILSKSYDKINIHQCAKCNKLFTSDINISYCDNCRQLKYKPIN